MGTDAVLSRLNALQLELNQRLHRIEMEQKELNSPDNDLWSDQAALHERDAEQIAVRMATQAELNLVNDAIARFHNGQYGICEICAEEIEEPRLSAVPYATRCMKHAI